MKGVALLFAASSGLLRFGLNEESLSHVRRARSSREWADVRRDQTLGRNVRGTSHCGGTSRSGLVAIEPHFMPSDGVAEYSTTQHKSVRMPGSSLWLLPPKSHPLDKILPKLIEQTSSHFGSSHSFLPHVTLTSEVSPSTYSGDPQAWLDALTLPSSGDVQVEFEKLASEDVFFRKLYIKCRKTDGVKKLAQVCREKVAGYEEDDKAETWAEEAYNPHLSLLYHDSPKVDASDLAPIEKLAQESGISLASEGQVRGWNGGRVVLVPTDKPIHQWVPIAERALLL